MEILAVALSAMLALANGLAADVPKPRLDEYQVKAAFLYNFARFVEWPASSFHGPGEPFTICVLGDDPFGQTLDDMVAFKAVAGRPIGVRRISDARETGECRMLFVASSLSKRDLAILAATKRLGVLTVGDAGISTADGMIIGFIRANGKVRFEINPAAADHAALHISAKLLSLAQERDG